MIDINLELDNELTEIVITTNNIKRAKKALGYAQAEIDGSELAQKAEQDATRAFTGKASGVQITQTSGVAGSGTNVVIRNYSSINGNNQALFIVDGVPYNNNTNAQGGAFQANNGSSRLLDLDPNNIESVSVLKGLAAATLYGSEGRNGVILITTKTASRLDEEIEDSSLCASLNQIKPVKLSANFGAARLDKNLLYIVDGQVINPYYNELVAALDNTSIERKRSYDKAESKRLFGDLAKNGCVVITTQEGNYRIEQDDRYAHFTESPFIATTYDPQSTFSINVGEATYNDLMQLIIKEQDILFDSVKIEELINHFEYTYQAPENEHPIAVHTEVANSPWNTETKLVKIGLKAQELTANNLPAFNDIIAKDVKVEIAFDTDQVKSYRLIGYGNKQLINEEFKDFIKNGEDMKSGQTVTALYEVIPKTTSNTQELLTVKLKYKKPRKNVRKEFLTTVYNTTNTIQQASEDFKFAAAIALFGMQLQDSQYVSSTSNQDVIKLAQAGKGNDTAGRRSDFIQLLRSR